MSVNVPLISLLVTEPLYDGTRDTITEIPLDARVGSTYRFSAESTQDPVESGATITDHVHLRELSMGMSGDFEVAIEEGATILRIGSALVGPR